MNVKETFLNLLKKFVSDWKNILIAVLIITAMVLYFNYRHTQKKLNFVEAEKIELADSISEYKNKVGDLYKAKETYVTTIKDLKKLNSDLSAEVKKLKDNPLVVTKIEYETKIKTIYIKDSLEYDDTLKTYKSSFNYEDRWAQIEGFTMFDFCNMNSYTMLNNINFTGNFYFDVIEKNKKLYTAVRSDSPYIQINNIESAILSPENSKVLKQHFRRPWGISAGLGASVVIVNGTVKICPGISVIVGYKFIDF